MCVSTSFYLLWLVSGVTWRTDHWHVIKLRLVDRMFNPMRLPPHLQPIKRKSANESSRTASPFINSPIQLGPSTRSRSASKLGKCVCIVHIHACLMHAWMHACLGCVHASLPHVFASVSMNIFEHICGKLMYSLYPWISHIRRLKMSGLQQSDFWSHAFET